MAFYSALFFLLFLLYFEYGTYFVHSIFSFPCEDFVVGLACLEKKDILITYIVCLGKFS